METKNFVTMAVTLIIGIVLTVGVLTPVISNASVTETVYTNDAEGTRFEKTVDDFSISWVIEPNGAWTEYSATAINGTDMQTVTWGDVSSFTHILFAGNDVIATIDFIAYVGEDATVILTEAGQFAVERTSGNLTVTYTLFDADGEQDSFTIPASGEYYIPYSDGDYIEMAVAPFYDEFQDAQSFYANDDTVYLSQIDMSRWIVAYGDQIYKRGDSEYSGSMAVSLDMTETDGMVSSASYTNDDVTIPVCNVLTPVSVIVSESSLSPTVTSLLSIIPLLLTVGLVVGAISFLRMKN